MVTGFIDHKDKVDKMLPHFNDFLLNLQSSKYSQETTYNYERDLKVFDTFLAESNIDFEKLDRKTITHYKSYLVSQERKTATLAQSGDKLDSRSVNRMLSAIRSYLHYLIDMDHPCPLTPDTIKLTKTSRKKPQLAKLNDLVRLIESPTSLESDPKVALRNRAMLEILFATGMRISELCNLNRNQVDNNGRILITGKGWKQRLLYLNPRAKLHLNSYLASRDDTAIALFVPYSGRNVVNPQRRISINYLQERIKKYRENLQIDIPTSAHSLRQGFTMYLVEAAVSPAAIQILLGHESLDITTRYVHTSDMCTEETHTEMSRIRDQR